MAMFLTYDGDGNALDDPQLLSQWFFGCVVERSGAGSTLARCALAVTCALAVVGCAPLLARSVYPTRGQALLGTVQIQRERTVSFARTTAGCTPSRASAWPFPSHPELTPPAKAKAQAFAVRERYGVSGLLGLPLLSYLSSYR